MTSCASTGGACPARALVPGGLAGRVEQFADEGLRHHAGHRVALVRQPDQRAPERDAGDEGARAVDRIDDPDMVARRVLGAELLAEYAVAGILGPDQRADGLLGLAVGLGHRIESALQLVGDVAGLPEPGQGLGGRSSRDAPEELS